MKLLLTFSKNTGFKNFNTNAIANRAGVSIGSLYQFFPDKDAILIALIYDMKARSQKRFEQVMTGLPDDPLPKTLRRLVRATIDLHRDRPILYRVLEEAETRLVGPHDPLGKDSDIKKKLAELLRKHSREVKVTNYDEAASDVFCIVQALVHTDLSFHKVRWKSLELRICRAVDGYLCSSLGQSSG